MIRMFFLIYIFSIITNSYSQEMIELRERVDLNVTHDIDPTNSEFFSVQPFFLSFQDDKRTLKATVVHYEFQGSAIIKDYIYVDTETNNIEKVQSERKYLFSIFDSPIPIVDDKPVIEEFQVSLEEFGYINYALTSPNGELLLTNHLKIIDPRGAGFTQSNVLMWQKNSPEGMLIDTYMMPFEMEFSTSENYFYIRGNNFYEIGKEIVYESEFRTVLDANMINLNTLEEVEANADVAFTSNERYFVTERDEVPTLVDTETDENLLHYDMPVRMVGATFSPDDQTLYLTGLDNNLYVFDSNLPTVVDDWMLQ